MIRRNSRGLEIDWHAVGVILIAVGSLIAWVIQVEVSAARQSEAILANEKRIEKVETIVRQNKKGIARIESDIKWIKEFLKNSTRE